MRTFPTQMRQRLRSHWLLLDHSPQEQARLSEIQLAATQRPQYVETGAMCLSAVLVSMLGGAIWSPVVPALWLLALAFNPVSMVWLPRSRRWRQADTRTRLILLHLQAASTAAVFTLPVLWLFTNPEAPDGLRVFLALIGTGVVCIGAFGYVRLPLILLTWLLAYGGLGLFITMVMDLPQTIALMIIVATYIIVMFRSGLEVSLNLVRRCAAEFDAERQTQTVSLLLSDFETSSRDWFWECDEQLRLTHASASMCAALECRPADLLGHSVLAVFQDCGCSPLVLASLASRLGQKTPFKEITLPLEIGGQRHWWNLSAKPLPLVQGRPSGWRGVGLDVTAAHRHEQALQRLANLDTLTGLSNRHAFQQALQQHLPPQGPSTPLALMLMDLDGFKAVNDAHGHGVGDALLQAVAQRLSGLVSPQQQLSRLGGDEFVLLLPGRWSAAEVTEQGEHLLDALREPFQLGPLCVDVRASIGTARTPEDTDNATALLQAADMALYQAKTRGRNGVCAYDTAIGRQAQVRAKLIQDLSNALANGELTLVYQPLFDARTDQPVGAEALLRWTHPHQGAVAPDSFIPLAESTGLILPIGAWVLQQACQAAAQWRSPCFVAVNISARQLDHPERLLNDVRDALTAHGLPAHRLELEVTESGLLDRRQAAQTLTALRALGVRLVLDDFGTGFSSLSYLQHLPFDGLKIDRSFIHPLVPSTGAASNPIVLRAIIELARGLNLSCTAEGIESDAHLQAVRALGCDQLQGYHLGLPLDGRQVQRLLGEARQTVSG